MSKEIKQQYDKYTREDHEVWTILFDRQMERLKSRASAGYLQGIERVGFSRTCIPDFREVDRCLAQLTGWSLYGVGGIVPNREFFTLLDAKRFPATSWLRSRAQLDYLEEPDMFHDVFGHVPLLGNSDYCRFMQELSRLGLKYYDNEHAVELIGRIYWFTVEFGLVEDREGLRVYGAGILSSAGETEHCLGSNVVHKPFDAMEILGTSYCNTRMQDLYFVIESFGQLYESMPLFEAGIASLCRDMAGIK